jgi:hypothetical protein
MAVGDRAPRIDRFRFQIPGGTYQTALLCRGVVLRESYTFGAAWFVPLEDHGSANGNGRTACVYKPVYAGASPTTNWFASVSYINGVTATAFVANPIPRSVPASQAGLIWPAGCTLVAALRDVGGGADYAGGGVILVDMVRA